MIFMFVHASFLNLFAQEDTLKVQQMASINVSINPDSLNVSEISTIKNYDIDSIESALNYLREFYENDSLWKIKDDPFRKALGNLIHYVESDPIDSVIRFFRKYPYSKWQEPLKSVPEEKDTTVVKEGQEPVIPAIDSVSITPDTVQVIYPDTLTMSSQDTTFLLRTDTTSYLQPDSIPSLELRVPKTDSLYIIFIDSTYLTVKDTIHLEPGDSIIMPFTDFFSIGMGDSIRYAIRLLTDHIKNDSAHIWLKNLANDSTNIWLKRSKSDWTRFWLKNELMDSIGIWVENDNRNSLKIMLDDNLYIGKIQKQQKIDDLVLPEKVDKTLREMTPLYVKPQYWETGGIGSVNLTQGVVSNWASGGESAISTLTDINMVANFSKDNTKWNNNARFKYGLIKSGNKRLRKNEDMFEINSEFGQKAFGRLGKYAMEKYNTKGIKHWYYSFLVSFKSQIARGYNYPNDSVVVSGFCSPGYLVFALGLSYRPNKQTSLLISPITSKSTFVTDTVLIDQTKYGISQDRKGKNEMGAYLESKFIYNFNEDISLENKLSLFTNYVKNPQNIDIDWEAILRMKITYYINALISTHFVYDDDVKVPVFNNEGVKTGVGPRLQFKEIFSIGFSYKL
jgi:hypothetical protein